MIWASFLKGGFKEEALGEMEGSRPKFTGRREAGQRTRKPVKTRARSALGPKACSPEAHGGGMLCGPCQCMTV